MALLPESWYPDDPQTCLLLADTITVLHLGVVLFVVLGQLLILLGRPLGWRWVGNRVFRVTHLAIIAFVAAVAAMGDLCFLTIWENELRSRAGQPLERSSFLGYWAHEILFVEVELDVLRNCYIAFALLVVASVFFVPVRWRKPVAPQ